MFKALALYQPVAIDLRFIVAVLKMTNDLERMSDLAAGVAKNAILYNKRKDTALSISLNPLAILLHQSCANALIHYYNLMQSLPAK